MSRSTSAANRLLLAFAVGVAGSGALAEPWTIEAATGLPDWLTLSGSLRIRGEWLDGQYRVGRSRSDQLVSTRTTLFAEARGERVRAGLEVFDSRGFRSDEGGSLGTSEVNVLEPVQAYLAFALPREASTTDLLFGRFTLDLGSRRLIGRNNFRNTTNSFTGALLEWSDRGEDPARLTAFYSLPQQRLPDDRAALLDNEWELDEERGDLRFWGLFGAKPRVFGDVAGELYLFGLEESDDADRPTRNRQLYTPGLRLYTPAGPGRVDAELELMWQFGHARATAAVDDVDNLDVSAQSLHVDAGYTFEHPWQPRLEASYDYASGDDPGDGSWQRFDVLYGTRRSEWSPTGIFGPLSRVNISAPGLRLEVQPATRWDVFVAYKAAWLAEQRDVMDRAGVVDVSGGSGSFIGHLVEFRARYWMLPRALRLDFGGATLLHGGFLDHAPNAPGFGDTWYGYADLTWTF